VRTFFEDMQFGGNAHFSQMRDSSKRCSPQAPPYPHSCEK
jgi:hypothetical protein